MSSDDALEHRTRKVVYNYISTNPGATFTTIQNSFSLAEGTLRYHLHYLERHGIVQSESKGKYRCYYLIQRPRIGQKPFPDINLEALTDVQKQLVLLVTQNPGITMGELVEKTNYEMRALQYNMKILRDQMIIWKAGNGRASNYEIASKERIQKELFKVVINKFLRGEIDEETYLYLKGEIERERLQE